MKILKLEIDKKLAGKSLEKILRENLGLSRREVSRAKFQPKGICIDGKRQRITYRPSVGQNLEVCLAEMQEEKSRVKPCAGKLEILYEDRDLLVVEKPGGIPCHPGRGHYEDSLGNRVADYLQKQGEGGVVRAVGRLDKDTAGLMVYAKNQMAAARLSAQKQDGRFQKIYYALAKGKLEQREGDITASIALMPGDKLKMQIHPQGKTACTRYEVLKERENCTLVKCRIFTGRTQQIRVHMAGIGNPLLGDVLYGDGQNPVFDGLALYAGKAEFYQPFTQEKIVLWGRDVKRWGIQRYFR